jgi:endonuclease YncB( thermonuclease family)
MKTSYAIFTLCLIGLGFAPAQADPLLIDHRAIVVIDGDTVQVDGRVLQFEGFDAPELGQACDHDGNYWLCGLSAAYELKRLIELQVMPLECEIGGDGKDRLVCLIGGQDLAIAMIKSGLAVANADSPLNYRMSERQAHEAGLGIWGGTFVRPQEWRQGTRLPKEHAFGLDSQLHGKLPWKLDADGLTFEPSSEHAACLVKGVALRRTYFGPLDDGYDALRLNPKRGDRLFCGDDPARVAGWTHIGESPRL